MTVGCRILPRRRRYLDRPPRARRNPLCDRTEGGGCAGREVDEAGRSMGHDLEDELGCIVHVHMVARLLAIAEQRDAPILERLAHKSVRAVRIVRVASAIEPRY